MIKKILSIVGITACVAIIMSVCIYQAPWTTPSSTLHYSPPLWPQRYPMAEYNADPVEQLRQQLLIRQPTNYGPRSGDHVQWITCEDMPWVTNGTKVMTEPEFYVIDPHESEHFPFIWDDHRVQVWTPEGLVMLPPEYRSLVWPTPN